MSSLLTHFFPYQMIARLSSALLAVAAVIGTIDARPLVRNIKVSDLQPHAHLHLFSTSSFFPKMPSVFLWPDKALASASAGTLAYCWIHVDTCAEMEKMWCLYLMSTFFPCFFFLPLSLDKFRVYQAVEAPQGEYRLSCDCGLLFGWLWSLQADCPDV